MIRWWRALFMTMLLGALPAHAPLLYADPAGDDVLADTAFDREVAVDMKNADLADVFRLLSDVTQIRFKLDMPSGHKSKVTLNVSNASARTILNMLANTSRLDYVKDGRGGIVVKWKGPRGGDSEREIVHDKIVQAGTAYELTFRTDIPDQGGRGEYRVIAPAGECAEIKQGIGAREVTALAPRGCATEQRFVGAFWVKYCVKGEADGGLEILMELTHPRVLGEKQYAEEHTFDRRIVGKGETVLFTTDDFEIVLTEWKRVPGKRTEVTIEEAVEKTAEKTEG